MAAMNVGRSDNALGASYRRMAARVGKPKAITATARKISVLVNRMLRDHILFHELSIADYEQLHRSRVFRGLRRRATSLGFELIDTQTGLLVADVGRFLRRLESWHAEAGIPKKSASGRSGWARRNHLSSRDPDRARGL